MRLQRRVLVRIYDTFFKGENYYGLQLLYSLKATFRYRFLYRCQAQMEGDVQYGVYLYDVQQAIDMNSNYQDNNIQEKHSKWIKLRSQRSTELGLLLMGLINYVIIGRGDVITLISVD